MKVNIQLRFVANPSRPDHVVVITNEEGAELVEYIATQAKSVLNTDFTVEVHTVSDPFTSFLEGRELAKVLARKKGSENIVNLTGGTTALQDAVQCIARLLAEEETLATKHAKIFVAKMSESVDGDALEERITRLAEFSANGNGKKIIEALMEMVPTYSPNSVNILNDNSQSACKDEFHPDARNKAP